MVLLKLSNLETLYGYVCMATIVALRDESARNGVGENMAFPSQQR